MEIVFLPRRIPSSHSITNFKKTAEGLVAYEATLPFTRNSVARPITSPPIIPANRPNSPSKGQNLHFQLLIAAVTRVSGVLNKPESIAKDVSSALNNVTPALNNP